MANVTPQVDSIGVAETTASTPAARPKQMRGPLAKKPVRLVLGIAAAGVVLGVLAFALVRFLGPSQKFAAIILPYVQEFVDMNPKQWFLGDGVWALREDMLSQNANLNKPAAIYVPGKIADEQPYHLSAYVTLTKPTQQAGINFNAQYPNMTRRQHQVYLSRRPTDLAVGEGEEPLPMELVAGYTDEEGAFVRQVAVPFGPDTGEYRLDLYVLGNTYSVQVNGQTLIERRPLFYANGLVGFHTLGPARFDSLKITTAATGDPGEQVYASDFDQEPAGAGWVPFSGEWEIADGELVQANPAAQDAGIGYEGSAFEEYAVEVSLRHLTGSGGGVLFNMASPYQLNDSHVVRYSDQTDSIFWGYFDEKGEFTRQGFADVEAPGVEVRQLRAFVGSTSYDVYLGDQMLSRDIPLHAAGGLADEGRSGGHVGLITSRSSVAFRSVAVFPLLRNAAISTLNGIRETPAPTETINDQDTAAAAQTATQTATNTATATKTPTRAPTSTPTATPLANGTPASATAPIEGETLDGGETPAASSPAGIFGPGGRATATLTATQTTRAAATPQATATGTATAPATQTEQAAREAQASETAVQGESAEWQSEFRGNLREAGWRPISGQWRFSNGSLAQDDVNGYDRAIAYARTAYQNYSFSTTFRHRDGNGAGLLFNLPNADRLNGGHMVRYSERRPGGIFWGYFDESGKFVGQGYANVAPPGDVSHTIRVASSEETYDVYLDNFLLATDVPLQSKGGYVGLVTAQTTADFDNTQVEGLEAKSRAGQTPVSVQPLTAPGIYSGVLGFTDQAVVSGKWVVEEGVFRQTVPDPADYILNTGILGSNYSIEADVLLANKPEIGGGFVVQAPERGRKAGSTVVRFTNGGDGLFWGVYDESGAFRGRESVDLPLKPEGETGYVLRVDVRGNRMDVTVDEEVLFEDALLPAAQGSIGLLAFGGPVTFTNVQITVRQEDTAP